MKAPVCFFLFVASFVSLPAQIIPPFSAPVNMPDLQARAAKGDAEAELELGRVYHLGKGVPKDFVKAGELYRQSAVQGNAKAMYNLGYLSEQGEGVPVDNTTAIQWFQKSADAGLPAGQLKMGEIYYFGDHGLPLDYAAAKKWLTLAAQQKDAPIQTGNACELLGSIYEGALGVPVDKEQAVTWYTKAAELNNARAQFDLGRIYIEGAPIKKNPVLSYKWLKLAAAQGDLMALHLMPDYMSGKVYSDADMAEGNRQIEEFRVKMHQPPVGTITYPMVPTVAEQPPVLPKAHAKPATSAAPKATAPSTTAAMPNTNSTGQN